MYRGFTAEIRRVVLLTSICIVLGLLNDHLTWTLIAGGALYMGWTLWQIYRLEAWISSREPGLPPDASGFWGDIFDRIYHLQRRSDREKLRLQSTLNRVQETTAALPDAVILLDERGNMTWWNETASELLRFQASDRYQPLTNFLRNPRFIAYYEGGNYKDPITLPAPHSPSQYYQYQVTRYGQDERLILVRDVTRLQRLEQVRRDFVANVSHELRTPLTVIKGYLETLSDQSEQLSAQWQKALLQMHQQSDRMTLLVNDLITLARLETEAPSREELVPVARLLATIGSEATVYSGGDHLIEVDCDTDISIRGSEKELHSAISNLVVNAIKYSPANTRIELRFSADEKGIHIAVQDQGTGIDPVHIPRLTERFYRVDGGRTTRTGGIGLGLAIVKHVLLRHDARLHIQSQPGKGSTFTCTFPLSRVGEARWRRGHLEFPH